MGRSTRPAHRRQPRTPSGSEIRELRVALEERQLLDTRRSVAVLREDDLGKPLLIALVVVVLVAVHEHDEIRVLLYRSAFSQVGKDRPLVVSLFDRTRELRHR